MSVTMKQVRAILDSEEPDYSKVQSLGPDALPILRRLIKGTDEMLAAKAASAAGAIGGPEALPVIDEAARSANVVLRVTAAGALKQLTGSQATEVLVRLLDDSDSGVRRQALRAAIGRAEPSLRAHLQTMTTNDKDASIRAEATKLLRQ